MAVDATVGTLVAGTDPAPAETGTIDTAPIATEPLPALSPETEALGQQIVLCAAGDADPALVAEALALIEADPSAAEFDLACVESVLTTFSNETLELIIAEASGAMPSETAADVSISVSEVTQPTESEPPETTPMETSASDTSPPEVSVPEEAIDEAMVLLACAPDLLEGMEPTGSEPVQTTEG